MLENFWEFSEAISIDSFIILVLGAVLLGFGGRVIDVVIRVIGLLLLVIAFVRIVS